MYVIYASAEKRASRMNAQEGARSVKRDRRGKFVELAELRMVKTIKAIRLVANLSNRTHYEFNESDVRKIVGALNREVEQLERRFKEIAPKSDIEFKL